MQFNRIRVNEGIRYPKIRVILDNGEQLGVMTSRDALMRAKELQLDLIEVAPNADPPVCKIMDFGKLKYEISKKEKQSKKKQHTIVTKTINIKPNIAENDLSRKITEVKQFLEKNFRVMFCIEMKGRESTHPELAYRHLERLKQDVGESTNVETMPKAGSRISVMLQRKS